MSEQIGSRLSAPEVMLERLGSRSSYKTMVVAARGLSDDDLTALENDLDMYVETGLIGVRMSSLLVEIMRAPQSAHVAA